MKNFPTQEPKTLADVQDIVRYIQKERKNDVNDFLSIKDKFISGRKVDKIPTGASDVSDLDAVGDFNIADVSGTTYLYTLVNISGTAEWRRVALSTW